MASGARNTGEKKIMFFLKTTCIFCLTVLYYIKVGYDMEKESAAVTLLTL